VIVLRHHLLELLCCPACGSQLESVDIASTVVLRCRECGCTVPVRDGVPRFVSEHAGDAMDPFAQKTQASFGYEWTHFSDWKPSGTTNFAQYFGDLDPKSLQGLTVLDAGCGMGRHARQIAPHATTLIAMDFSAAIDQAARNTADLANVQCVQGDILKPPVRNDSFDLVYSLGVIHHLSDPEAAVRALVKKVKPRGRFRAYLYWKRSGVSAMLLNVVALVRRVTTKLPFGVLRRLCWVLSILLYGAVVIPYRVLSQLGVRKHHNWPLYVYTPYPFRVLYNDQFDRFSAPIEKRYDADEVVAMLRRAGLDHVRVWPSFGWIAEGTRADLKAPPLETAP
jgi:SAM-dependent methyltransferase